MRFPRGDFLFKWNPSNSRNLGILSREIGRSAAPETEIGIFKTARWPKRQSGKRNNNNNNKNRNSSDNNNNSNNNDNDNNNDNTI